MEFDPEAPIHSFSSDPQHASSKVSYFYDPDVGSYYYGPGHPMKPQRMRMTHSLILSYNLYRLLEVRGRLIYRRTTTQVYRPHEASHSELTMFHDTEYVNFLSEIGPDNTKVSRHQSVSRH